LPLAARRFGSIDARFQSKLDRKANCSRARLRGGRRNFDSNVAPLLLFETRIKTESFTKSTATLIFAAAVTIGTVLKIYCASTTYGTNDTGLFQLYGQAVYEAGLEETYRTSQHFNHTPMLAMVLVGLYWLSKTFAWSYPLLLRLPGIAADVVTALVVWRAVTVDMPGRISYAWACLFALSPVSFMVSGYHGNFDSILAMFVLLATYCAFKERIDLCAFFFTFAVNVKIAALLLSPVFFFFWLGRGKALRFSIITACLLLPVWITPLIQYPALALHNVFGYGSYWGIWGITYWLRQTGYPPFHLVSFYDLSSIQNHIMTMLKIVAATGIVILAWRRSRLGSKSIFASVSYSFAIFFAFAPGVLLHYLAWPSCIALFHARRWYLVLLAANSVFLFRCYTVINNGLPWDKGFFTAQVLDRWIGWSNIPWLAYLVFLGCFVIKEIRLSTHVETSLSNFGDLRRNNHLFTMCDATAHRDHAGGLRRARSGGRRSGDLGVGGQLC